MMATNKWTKGGLRPSIPAVRRERGQAMVFFVLTVLTCLLVTIAMFNVGQTVSEKIRVTNTADAAAYSGALWEARMLNFQAYTNRAMVANEVAIGQGVSLVSWFAYVKSVTENLQDYLFWVPYLGAVLAEVNDYVGMAKEWVTNGVKVEIGILDNLIKGLSTAQGVAHAAAVAAVPGIVREVVKANDPQSDVTGYSNVLMAANLLSWNGFTKTYSGDDRIRFKEVTMNSRDGFTQERSWTASWPFIPVDAPGDMIFPDPMMTVKKRGGTDLIGLDEWRGVDTLAGHYDYLGWCGGKIKVPCWKNHEARFGYGAATAYNQQVGSSGETGYHGNAPGENPRTYNMAMSEIEDLTSSDSGGNSGFGGMVGGALGGLFGSGIYSGLPKYRDIADLTNTNPTAGLAVEVAKDGNVVRTSGNAGIGTGRLQLSDCLAGGSINKLTKAEVYFKHPDTYAGYGDKFKRGEEYGSLFNPYWQVRLIQPSAAEQAGALIGKGSC